MQNNQSFYLRHERLDVWHEAIALVKLVREQRIANAELRDQAVRAAMSVALNIAEGANRGQRAASNHFRIARGSAGEVGGAYQVAVALGETVDAASVKQLAASVSAKLGRLARNT